MTEDHERIDELLAGYVLLSLSGEDAAEADQVLIDHVPSCARCRATLSDLEAVSGDLALAAPPVDPPETLLPRLHRAMDDVPLAGRTRRRGALIAVAASAVALVAMGGLSLVLGSRLSNAETRTGTALEILSAMRSPGASPVNVSPQDQTPADSGIVEVSAPDIRTPLPRRGVLSRARPRSRVPAVAREQRGVDAGRRDVPAGRRGPAPRGPGHRRVAVRRGVDHPGGGRSDSDRAEHRRSQLVRLAHLAERRSPIALPVPRAVRSARTPGTSARGPATRSTRPTGPAPAAPSCRTSCRRPRRGPAARSDRPRRARPRARC